MRCRLIECDVAELVMRRRQARVQFSRISTPRSFPTELTSDEEMEEPLRMAADECDGMHVQYVLENIKINNNIDFMPPIFNIFYSLYRQEFLEQKLWNPIHVTINPLKDFHSCQIKDH